MGENYYPQVFLEEKIYLVKENKMKKFINKEFEISSNGSDEDLRNYRLKLNIMMIAERYLLKDI